MLGMVFSQEEALFIIEVIIVTMAVIIVIIVFFRVSMLDQQALVDMIMVELKFMVMPLNLLLLILVVIAGVVITKESEQLLEVSLGVK